MGRQIKKREKVTGERLDDANRLYALYKQRVRTAKISQDEFGEANEIGTASAVSQYLNGYIPLNMEVAIKFAKGLRCAVEDFSPSLASKLQSSDDTLTHANVVPLPTTRGRVPMISWVQAGCWMEVVDNFAPGMADEWIDVEIEVRKHTFALTVRGDSMSPRFPDGMILVVEPDIQADNGDFVIAKNGNNEATFKQLVIDGGVWYLKPLNERYPIMQVGSDTIIVGVVREAIHKIRLK